MDKPKQDVESPRAPDKLQNHDFQVEINIENNKKSKKLFTKIKSVQERRDRGDRNLFGREHR